MAEAMQMVVDILQELLDNGLSTEQIDESIDRLEEVKNEIDLDKEEEIDKVDEVQDYLQYLLTIEEFSAEEATEEVAGIINGLKK